MTITGGNRCGRQSPIASTGHPYDKGTLDTAVPLVGIDVSARGTNGRPIDAP
jgi:hypothetical protein